MAEFSKIIPTDNGRALMAEVIGGATMEFTRMVLSDTVYTVDDLYTLTDIADIKQETEISAISATGDASVRISAAITNEDLTEGYTIRSVGLYARPTDGDEILYAAAIETTGTYEMPAQTGTTISSAYMQWIVTVGNSENVSVVISSNAYALAVDVDEKFAEIELKMDDYVEIADIVDNCTTTDAKRPLSANQGKILYDLYQNIDQSLSGSFAPISHASSATTYGVGTSSLYGHLKISDNYTSSAGAASAGVAASSQAVYNTYNSLLSKFTDGSVSKIGTSTVGSGTKPIYLNSGTPTASSSTVGSGTQPVYLNGGTITALGTTVGGAARPIYSASGVLTACSSTVGSGVIPIYMSSGTLTASSSTVGSGTKPIYLSSGTLTASSSTVGSTTQPVYLNSGTLTAMSGALSTSYGGTGNTSGRATYVNVTSTNPSSATTYYVPFTTGITSGSNYSLDGNNGYRYYTLEGTTSAVGYGIQILGNSTASGTAANKYGAVRMYGTGANYWTLSGNKSTSSNYTLYMPLSGGCLVAATNGSAVGSSSTPVYINSSGVATACSYAYAIPTGTYSSQHVETAGWLVSSRTSIWFTIPLSGANRRTLEISNVTLSVVSGGTYLFGSANGGASFTGEVVVYGMTGWILTGLEFDSSLSGTNNSVVGVDIYFTLTVS